MRAISICNVILQEFYFVLQQFQDIINGAYSVTVTKQDKTKARDEYNKILTIERQLVENCCTNKEEMGKYGEKYRSGNF